MSDSHFVRGVFKIVCWWATGTVAVGVEVCLLELTAACILGANQMVRTSKSWQRTATTQDCMYNFR